ncbi:ATPase/histidine kinase/DNA gyrase B/HSP90 domain protein [Acetobacteraceae bacterium AT-5844]|nr:ATPase/histidine kinase/DNA gyrase B/HSP90 domain protein [Acetobacteraceae bacterium AT-5844]
MPPALDLRLPPTAEGIGTMLDRLEAYAEDASLPPALASHLCLICEELAANIAEHATPAGASLIAVTVRPEGAALRVMVEDDGPAFDPLHAPAPDTAAPLEERAIGGLGLHFVRTLAREVCYARADGRNRLSLTLGLTD